MTKQEKIDAAIAAFNADDSKTHRSNPDSRYHYHARRPIFATDCDYEIVGFSGVQGRDLVEIDDGEGIGATITPEEGAARLDAYIAGCEVGAENERLRSEGKAA